MVRLHPEVPLPNRVTPFGEVVAARARGSMMGNRGGRFHDDRQRLGARRWVSRAWICCELHFKGRRRAVMAKGYTELFFFDEVTALAAGHRPCFECRRADAKAFQATFPHHPARAADMDRILHAERLARHEAASTDSLPDGAVWAVDRQAYTRWEGRIWRWSFEGWHPARPNANGPVHLLTPPSITQALRNGYTPRWHRPDLAIADYAP